MTPLLNTPQEVQRLLGRLDVLIVDVRSFRAYIRGHIPSAVNLSLTDYHWADTSPTGLVAFSRHMQRVLGFIGVDEEKHVVFYENISGMSAARGVWLLHYLGHKRVSLLDGGLKSWRAAGYPVLTEPTAPRPNFFRIRPNSAVLARADEVRRILRRTDIRILDARSPREFRGEQVRAARGGCIPGARNINWRRALTRDGRFRPRIELEQLYRRAGFRREQEMVTYCQGGYRSSHAYVALKLLGFPKVRNYIGSWFEWGNSLRYPVSASVPTRA